MDKKNEGKLDINELYGLMQNFEQEQKKALTLKWVVIALAGFAVLLALANIGTSFAAATLAKDVTTTPSGMLADKNTGEALGTEQVDEQFDVDDGDGTATPPDPPVNATDGSGRFLETVGLSGGRSNDLQLSQNKVDRIMKAFCKNSWTTVKKYADDKCPRLQGCGFGKSYVTLDYWYVRCAVSSFSCKVLYKPSLFRFV